MDALERVIAFLPIILLVVIPALLSLRRIKKRRRQAALGRADTEEAGAAGASQAGASQAGASQGGTVGAGRAQGAAARAAPTAGPFPAQGAAAQTVSARSAAVQGQISHQGMFRPAGTVRRPVTGTVERERYAYPRPLEFGHVHAEGSQLAGAARVVWPVGRERWEPLSSLPSMSPGVEVYSGRPGAAVPGVAWERLAGLPALQRAIVLSEILGPPRALGFPDREL